MEGPQTRALAEHLNELITGKPVEQIVVPENRWQANVLLLNCVGQVIQRVRSHGKWLFFDFSHGITWMCQLITRAKWTVLSPDEVTRVERAWQEKKRGKYEPLITMHLRTATERIVTGATGPGNVSSDNVVAVLTGHPIFYILPSEKVRGHPEIRALGPDPLSTTTFFEDFPYRLRQNPNRTLAAALLDQEILAGLGNMLKCEILYGMRFPPTTRVATLLASQIDHLAGLIVGVAATATNFATKSEAYPYRVYDRAGLPCAICGSEITVDRSGQDGHLTWYCPRCQPVDDEPTLF